uniref:Uncharacterized protein n=1 Tax=Mesocestoides corti TaxID=53468 RepID=A0A5K3FLM2_MESCO
MSGTFHPSPPRWPRHSLYTTHPLLAAYLPRMPLEHRETQDWLRLGGPTYLRPDPTPHHSSTHNVSSAMISGCVGQWGIE